MRYFVRVEQFIPAPPRLVELPDGAKDPIENVAVLRKSKGGGTITVPVGQTVLEVGMKLKLVTRGDRVFLEKR